MALPHRPPLDERAKSRAKSFLSYVPHAIILTRVIDRLRALDHTPDSSEAP
ncbi:hypothetical protein [Nocardia brevicatena]|uniref:hypothetical protein n=1 Tax=Nocardia brevicatena TaxID=37327 RepID=UPI0002F75C48|nr:hypothetical protein [Nocardia brevicatena]